MGEGREVAILFADVVGSTHLYEALGDERARETVQQCLRVMREATEQFGGTVIKTMGDEVMATFPSAEDAMSAASQMQKRITLSSKSMEADGAQIAIRIGCHFGPVVAEDRDIFGASVHIANRMTSQAKAGQILTTATTVAQLTGEWRALARQIDVAAVKGYSSEMALFEVLWQPEEATSMLSSISWSVPEAAQGGRLVLRFRGSELVLGGDSKTEASMGRADENDVVVKGKLISRVHARIDLRKNRFVLIDESTNGTYIQPDGGTEVYVRRDSAELSGSGVIGMGRVAARGTPLAIEYRCEH